MVKYLKVRKFGVRGTALIYTLLTVGIILNIAFFLAAVFASKLKLAFDYPNSVTALYAAESGIEWQLYNRFKEPDANQPSLTNGATFTILTPSGQLPLKVRGVFRGGGRAIEVSF